MILPLMILPNFQPLETGLIEVRDAASGVPDADDFDRVPLLIDPVNDSAGAFDDFPDLFILEFGNRSSREREFGEVFNGIEEG